METSQLCGSFSLVDLIASGLLGSEFPTGFALLPASSSTSPGSWERSPTLGFQAIALAVAKSSS